MSEPVVRETAALIEEMIRQDRQTAEPVATLTNGIVLRGKAVPRQTLSNVIKRIPMPDVPRFVFELDGEEVSEGNPNDPDYLEAVEKVHLERLDATYRAMYALGTELVSVPEGVFRPEDDGWLELLEELGAVDRAEVPANPKLRYLMWLERYALETQDDNGTCFGVALAATGILETEVVAAVAYFRDKAQRGADRLSAALARRAAANRDSDGAVPSAAD